ncbi:glycosyltransferase family protein [Desulforhopalus sp. IMCC35007]|uniref:glycosyltransferase family protein n=1 Tax=Desulforhopalus sp. IMCC35007 TaxID=2569543 RepID=UPI0010AE9F09|nr:glycosyltransferase [Desulforhopalus sp. IMCC35007]TKB06329.1 glycosyl transferase [Desulforhopalus sp. IMCC35007]
MKISYYCQHVLGIGHLRRSLEVVKSLMKDHEVTLILGGPPVSIDTTGCKILKLPGLQMDREFNNLIPSDNKLTLEGTKQKRQELLYNHFVSSTPDCFITELYPFGRKAFRFELDPVLTAIKSKELPECKCICSVRDILVEKTQGKEKFEKRVIATLNKYYSAILVHADPAVVELSETFEPLAEIQTPLYYTGYVNETLTASNRSIRNEVNMGQQDSLIVASAGGGSVGSELFFAVISAFKGLLKTSPLARLQIFTGPYCDAQMYEDLVAHTSENIKVDRFSNSFTDWLMAADLSISMAGYNTCMNLLQTGVPALVLPFTQNREQHLRASKLSCAAPIEVLDKTDLNTEILLAKMIRQLQLQHQKTSVQLDGAARSLEIINTLLTIGK